MTSKLLIALVGLALALGGLTACGGKTEADSGKNEVTGPTKTVDLEISGMT